MDVALAAVLPVGDAFGRRGAGLDLDDAAHDDAKRRPCAPGDPFGRWQRSPACCKKA
jgi:hypothetical protein